MKKYHDLQLKCDVLLLADVFERFRYGKIKNDGLCPSHFFSAPASSWDAMLNITKIEIELFPDSDMYLFFEKGMRGGVFYISQRYSKAGNKYLESCDPKNESKHII